MEAKKEGNKSSVRQPVNIGGILNSPPSCKGGYLYEVSEKNRQRNFGKTVEKMTAKNPGEGK